MRKLACYMAATLAICGATVAVDSGNPKDQISAAAEKEIASVTAEIDRVEAEKLSQVQKGGSTRRNESSC